MVGMASYYDNVLAQMVSDIDAYVVSVEKVASEQHRLDEELAAIEKEVGYLETEMAELESMSDIQRQAWELCFIVGSDSDACTSPWIGSDVEKRYLGKVEIIGKRYNVDNFLDVLNEAMR